MFKIPHIIDQRGILAYFETEGQISFKIRNLEIITLDNLIDQENIESSSTIALIPINGLLNIEVVQLKPILVSKDICLNNRMGIVIPVSTIWRITKLSLHSKFVILYS